MFLNRKNNLKDDIDINIKINNDNQILVNYNCKNSVENIERLATALYSINNGLFMLHFIDGLTKEADNKKESIFINSVFDKWNTYLSINSTNNNINDPIVKPLGAFSKNVK